MKLLNYTSKYLFILLLPLITIWAVIFYYALLDEIYDSLDDGLENQKVLIVQRLHTDKTVPENLDFNRGNHTIKKISKKEYNKFDDNFKDTLMYMQNEEEFEPVRIYESTFKKNETYYKIKIITSMVEEDDLIKNLITYLVVLYLVMLISIVLLNNIVLRKIWKPFYSLISQLKKFRIENETSLNIKSSNIEEFELLNDTMKQLTEKSQKSYLNQKQFIENASHELQTPLAISVNKLELFSEKNNLTEEQLEEIGGVLDNLGRLTRLNKSLLLLSKIENQQFVVEESVDFTILIESVCADFEDLLRHKQMTFTILAKEKLVYKMNKDLALILITNLIKNAIIHGAKNETINITVTSKEVVISNIGQAKALNHSYLFARFKKANTDSRSTGLGLAIAKTITEKYRLQLKYSFDNIHNFSIQFPR